MEAVFEDVAAGGSAGEVVDAAGANTIGGGTGEGGAVSSLTSKGENNVSVVVSQNATGKNIKQFIIIISLMVGGIFKVIISS